MSRLQQAAGRQVYAGLGALGGRLFLDDRGQTLISGKTSAWADQSGNSNNANQETAGKRPVDSSVNALECPVFIEGASDTSSLYLGLVGSLKTWKDVVGVAGFSIVVGWDNTGISPAAASLHFYTDPGILTGDVAQICLAWNATGPCCGLSDGATLWPITGAAQLTGSVGRNLIELYSTDGTQLSVSLNGGAPATTAGSHQITGTQTTAYLGRNYNGTKNAGGKLFSLWARNSKLSTADSLALRSFLASRYGAVAQS